MNNSIDKELSLIDREIITMLKNSNSIEDVRLKKEFIIKFLVLNNKFSDRFYNDVPVKSNLEYEQDAQYYLTALVKRYVMPELCIGVVPCSTCNDYYLCCSTNLVYKKINKIDNKPYFIRFVYHL